MHGKRLLFYIATAVTLTGCGASLEGSGGIPQNSWDFYKAFHLHGPAMRAQERVELARKEFDTLFMDKRYSDKLSGRKGKLWRGLKNEAKQICGVDDDDVYYYLDEIKRVTDSRHFSQMPKKMKTLEEMKTFITDLTEKEEEKTRLTIASTPVPTQN